MLLLSEYLLDFTSQGKQRHHQFMYLDGVEAYSYAALSAFVEVDLQVRGTYSGNLSPMNLGQINVNF